MLYCTYISRKIIIHNRNVKKLTNTNKISKILCLELDKG